MDVFVSSPAPELQETIFHQQYAEQSIYYSVCTDTLLQFEINAVGDIGVGDLDAELGNNWCGIVNSIAQVIHPRQTV